ncbi:hypothetical protein VKT23_016875 [Stygiomarasmius scandens]|uniref:Thioesterase domain-containing protein n=1 Tax=Marasmiellus scandens TaxID=2682957 RepID=A0ABR1ITJ8_9AGAR
MSRLSRHFPRNLSGSIRRFSSTSSTRSRPATLFTLGLSTLAVGGAYTLGSVYPPPPLALLFPQPAPPPPTDPSDPAYTAHLQNIENQLQSLSLLQSLRSSSSAEEWYESRPYSNFPEDKRLHHLTAGALRGPGRLAIPPLVRARYDESESMVFIHLGRGLCGHDGIVHGGLLATLLDETMARTAINNLPERIGVTATLDLSYRAPTKADQFVVIKTKLIDVKGRKANVEARVEDMNGTLLVEAKAMFVQPRYANLLNKAAIRQVLGEPPVRGGEELGLAKGK